LFVLEWRERDLEERREERGLKGGRGWGGTGINRTG